MTITDGDDDDRLEAPFEPVMEETSKHEEVLILEPTEAIAHDDEGLTAAAISIVLCNRACARLALESCCGVGRCDTCGREEPKHECKACKKTYKTHLKSCCHRIFSRFLL